MSASRTSSTAPRAPGAEILHIAQGPAALNPAQRSFNRLTEQIARARSALAQWDAAIDQAQQRISGEVQPILGALTLLQRQLALQIDELLTHPPAGLRLTRRRRNGLTEFLLRQVDEVLANGDDPLLESLHDHYSDISLARRREIEQEVGLAMAEQMVGHLYGDDIVKNHGAESAEDFLREVDERMAERIAEAHRQREAPERPSKPNKRQQQAQARRAEAAQAVSQSLREVYRRLVSSLHPDRETDELERARKTALMKDINRAYESNDLLTLLTLQMEVEQINAQTLANLPAQRLQHYNEVLREQLRVLNEEISARTDQLRLALAVGPEQRLREPKEAERHLSRQIRALRETQSNLRAILEALANSHLRLAEIDAIAAAMARRQ